MFLMSFKCHNVQRQVLPRHWMDDGTEAPSTAQVPTAAVRQNRPPALG